MPEHACQVVAAAVVSSSGGVRKGTHIVLLDGQELLKVLKQTQLSWYFLLGTSWATKLKWYGFFNAMYIKRPLIPG